jgi:hypothetical protein
MRLFNKYGNEHMKHLIMAAAFAGMLAMPAQAEIVFRGVFEVTAASGCPIGPRVGDRDNMQFHPRALAGNSNFAALTTIWSYGGQEYRLRNGLDFTASYQVVRNGGLGWDIYTPKRQSSVLISATTPAVITANTPSVTLVGKIKNPDGVAGNEGCEIRFRAIMLKARN